MVTHMKTTIDIADSLLLRAKEEALRSNTTLRHLVERGLRVVLERTDDRTRFEVKPVTVRGKGLQPEFQGKSWDSIRAAIYELG